MEKLLLHHCCAPCSPGITSMLNAQYYVHSFWFNPNIHPANEHAKRKDSLCRFVSELGFPLHIGPEVPQDEWLRQAPANAPDRCRFCYRLRLEATARAAKELGIGFFSTTLLSSPFQKHDLIREIGFAVQEQEKVAFVSGDFRPYYYQGRNEAAKKGFYMQKYCGCVISLEERIREGYQPPDEM